MGSRKFYTPIDMVGNAILNAGLTVRHGSGYPAGAPTGSELPIAVNFSTSPHTWYYWDGAAWRCAVTGTAAGAWGYADAATGVEEMTGTAASAVTFSTDASGTVV